MTLEIPPSLKVEHEALHEVLRRATREPGALGDAARTVAGLLHPHFVDEEAFAMPPLGLLRTLARGQMPADTAEVLALTDRLQASLDRMLAEHGGIVAALDAFVAAARRAQRDDYVAFGSALKLHAQTEEEVLYPAAILVGRFLRARAPAPAA